MALTPAPSTFLSACAAQLLQRHGSAAPYVAAVCRDECARRAGFLPPEMSTDLLTVAEWDHILKLVGG